jgi:hypothetical protein
VADNTDYNIVPDDVILTDSNNVTIDLSSYVTAGGGSITGTWHAMVGSGGTGSDATAFALDLLGLFND